MSPPVVVVAGAMAAKPGNGGEAWVRLGWVRGLQQLGCDVRFVEVADVPPAGAAVEWFSAVTGWAGLAGRASLLDPQGTSLVGPDASALADVAGVADLLLDVSGNLRGGSAVDALRGSVRRRAYVDVDPGYTQLWAARGLLGDHLADYDLHLTIGDAVATCGLPTAGVRWHGIRPPVVLADWPVTGGHPAVLSTVATWRGAFGPVELDGRSLGTKVHEFRRLAAVPHQVPQRCEVALDIHAADAADVDQLRDGGWEVRDPAALTGTPAAYRSFIQASGGELSAAQGVYVGTACGWTSDRTAAYLASGKPAVVQDTGFGPELRGSALLPFSSPRQAAAACREVARDPAGYSAAARDLAEQHFASDRVLAGVLDLAGL